MSRASKICRSAKAKSVSFLNNLICLLTVAAVFAMIGIESGGFDRPTHEKTQKSPKQ